MSNKVQTWKSRWKGHYFRIPKLYHFKKNNQSFVYDSRYTAPQERLLTDMEKMVLDFLDYPRIRPAIDEWINNNSINDAELLISGLKSKDLIVEDHGKVVSLICKCDPKNELMQILNYLRFR